MQAKRHRRAEQSRLAKLLRSDRRRRLGLYGEHGDGSAAPRQIDSERHENARVQHGYDAQTSLRRSKRASILPKSRQKTWASECFPTDWSRSSRSAGRIESERDMALETITSSVKRRRTQWATQFLAAAELVRRGNTVAFTIGNNTPVADLMVGAPSGELFWVDVKGLSGKYDWLVKPKGTRERLFYILVLLAPLAQAPNKREPDLFFVLTQNEANSLEKAYRLARPNNKTTNPGFGFKDAIPYEDRWEILPS